MQPPWPRRAWRRLVHDARKTVAPYLRYPGPSFAFLALTGVLAVFPHAENNSFRKLVTFLLVATWIILTSGVALDVMSINPWIWGTVTGVVMMVWGQMWELEKYRVSVGPLELVHTNQDDE